MDDLIEEVRALRADVAAMRDAQSLPDLMTPEQCAAYLNRSVEALYNWRKARLAGEEAGPPFLHITSRTILYDREDVLEWARKHRIG